jgi:hypothetical protein
MYYKSNKDYFSSNSQTSKNTALHDFSELATSMVFNYLRKDKEVSRREIYRYSVIQAILTLFVITSSFTVVGVPLWLVVPYLAIFLVFVLVSKMQYHRLVKFRQDLHGNLVSNFESRAHLSYNISTISRIIISLIVFGLRVGLPQMVGWESPLIFIQEPSITGLVIVTVLLDLLLLSSKGVMVSIHRKMLLEYKKHADSKDNIF